MNTIIAGVGILLFIVGLVIGVLSVIVFAHNPMSQSIAPTIDWNVEAVVAIVFMVIGALVVILGIKKF
jgi:uncharacterized protein YacL